MKQADRDEVTNTVADLEHDRFWRGDPVLSRVEKRLADRARPLNMLLATAPFLLVVACTFFKSLGLFIWTAFLLQILGMILSFLIPTLVQRILRKKGYAALGFHERDRIFYACFRYLGRIPARDELLVIPGMREDAKSIFFVLSYFFTPDSN